MTPGTSGAKRRFCWGLEAGERKRTHGAAVEGAEERDDVLAAGVVSGELQGALDRLRRRSCRSRSGAGPAWARRREALGQRDHVLVVEVGAGHVDQLAGLLLDGGDDFGMAMAGGVDGDAGGEVEELVAVDVFDANAAAAFGHQGIGAGVSGEMMRASFSSTRWAFGPGNLVRILGPALETAVVMEVLPSRLGRVVSRQGLGPDKRHAARFGLVQLANVRCEEGN